MDEFVIHIKSKIHTTIGAPLVGGWNQRFCWIFFTKKSVDHVGFPGNCLVH